MASVILKPVILSLSTKLLFSPPVLQPDVTHFPHTCYHPHSSPGFTLTVDVFILSDQVRVSSMLAITVSPAIMGFELPEQRLGAQSRVWCVRSGEAPGPRSGLWCEVWVRAASDRSSLRQGSAHGESVSHLDECISQPNIRRYLSAFPWHWFVEHLFWHLP